MTVKQTIFKIISAIWTGADSLRKVLHLILLLFIFMIFFGAMSGGVPPSIPKNAALLIQPVGSLVEQLEGDPVDRAFAELAGDGRPQTLVQDIVDALEFAQDDDRIEVVYLELTSVFGAGLSKLQRIAEAIDEFRATGKTVIASADFLSQQAYYIAAHADEVYLHPEGLLLMRGYGRFRSYFKDAIDKLRLDWNVFRVGTHKSYVEPYTRMNMSDEDRETTLRLIDHLWGMYRGDVVAARGLEEGAIEAFTTNLLAYTEASGGDLAKAALEHGLVDELLTRTEVRDVLIDIVGEDPDKPDTFNATEMYEYLGQMRLLSGGTVNSDNVAVVIATGDIMFGSHPPGTIGGDSTSALLRRAKNDESIVAVVLRVDSPGGSAFAAEVIADEVRALRAAGKPVVASMSSIAASGGYSISMDADLIFARPSTITGSIGVWGMFPTYQRTFEALGIANDGVGSTRWSGELRPDREMSQHTKDMFQMVIEDSYDDFISRVSESRGLAKDEVDRIGQGQVWTGTDAIDNGLVDELGSFDDAIAAAAQLAGFTEGEYGIKYIRYELSPSEQFIVDLLGSAARVGIDVSTWVDRPAALEQLAGSVREAARALLRFNDPKGVYRHCLCDVF